MPGGAPSTYDPAFCARVIALGKLGKTVTAMAVALDVSRESLYEWSRRHPEFADALTRARQASVAWWEEQGERGVWAGKEFNDRVLKLMLGAMDPTTYREQRPALPRGLDPRRWSPEAIERVLAGEDPSQVLADMAHRGLLAAGAVQTNGAGAVQDAVYEIVGEGEPAAGGSSSAQLEGAPDGEAGEREP